MYSLLDTQLFATFIFERGEGPLDPEIRFFDESITAKQNRSKKMVLARGGKKQTSFLDDDRSAVRQTFCVFGTKSNFYE